MEAEHFHRRNLPHLYFNEGRYFITFRLADSLPLDFLKQLHVAQYRVLCSQIKNLRYGILKVVLCLKVN